jgi:hypothetical protein
LGDRTLFFVTSVSQFSSMGAFGTVALKAVGTFRRQTESFGLRRSLPTAGAINS